MDEQEQLSAPTESAPAEAAEPSNHSTDTSHEPDGGADDVGLLAPQESDDEEIEAAGEKYRVPKKLSAHLKELEQGHLRQDDYTRKTQSVAEKAREIEARAQAIQAREQFHQQHISAVAEVLAIDKQLSAFQKLDWNGLTDADPVQAMKLERQMRELQQQKTQLVHGIEQTRHQQTLAQQQAIARQREASIAQLEREIKGFRTPEVAKELYETGSKYGIRAEEWEGLDDPRLYRLIDTARKYEKLIAKQTTEARPKSAEVVPITRVSPGAGAVRKSMSDPNISMDDYIKLRNEQKRRK